MADDNRTAALSLISQIVSGCAELQKATHTFNHPLVSEDPPSVKLDLSKPAAKAAVAKAAAKIVPPPPAAKTQTPPPPQGATNQHEVLAMLGKKKKAEKS
ncbi:MAG TPA: hypothetical protein HPP80_07620 [Rhodospirillaceae bacterium]|nr:hypothetical protein [Rhodospirillaceae bacterium]